MADGSLTSGIFVQFSSYNFCDWRRYSEARTFVNMISLLYRLIVVLLVEFISLEKVYFEQLNNNVLRHP